MSDSLKQRSSLKLVETDLLDGADCSPNDSTSSRFFQDYASVNAPGT